MNPDPDVRADPEIDILKEEDDLANGDIEKFYDEEELGNKADMVMMINFSIFRKEAGEVETEDSMEEKSKYIYKKKVIRTIFL